MALSREECSRFEQRTALDGTRRRYWHVDYEVRLILEGIVMSYEFVVHRRKVRHSRYFEVVKRVELRLDCAGVFELFNSS